MVFLRLPLVIGYALNMKKRMSRHEAEVAKGRAERFLDNVLNDDDRADEISEMDIDEWAEKRGVTITNPSKRRKPMATAKTLQKLSKDELVDRVLELEEGNEELQEEVDTLSEKLDSISEIASTEEEGEEEDDENGDEEDEV